MADPTHALRALPTRPGAVAPLVAPLMVLAAALQSCVTGPSVADPLETVPTRVAFGSCADQSRPQPLLRTVVERDPDLFIYLGDNVYGDTEDMAELRAKYDELEVRPEFQALRAHCPLLATWDDHDYGANDSGRHYPMKAESKDVFLDFWREPKGSSRFDHPGIYHEEIFTNGERTVQVLLLDTRTFRDDLVLAGEDSRFKNDYRPNPDPSATILGEEQWRWLDHCLRAPADLRIIATSIQFGHSYNGWESWTNVPHERQKMIDVIRGAKASGVLFVSGDVHWGEISRQEVPMSYPLYDVTASGINQDWDVIEPNARRVGPAVAQHNFGLIEIDWALDDPSVTLRTIDELGAECNRVELRLSELR